ncbi:MAG: hypothetical protein MR630_06970 [Selenomonas sp.]|uniref:hypothetical protein n=1 Tax=Selenomonas sp. TaxID=2053611 RepID=UPI0025D2CBA7|nr:hypothetical protein [Selenomonas sp.]MCI6232336.1 hypothetical protein [Selenomonas sp.]
MQKKIKKHIVKHFHTIKNSLVGDYDMAFNKYKNIPYPELDKAYAEAHGYFETYKQTSTVFSIAMSALSLYVAFVKLGYDLTTSPNLLLQAIDDTLIILALIFAAIILLLFKVRSFSIICDVIQTIQKNRQAN